MKFFFTRATETVDPVLTSRSRTLMPSKVWWH